MSILFELCQQIDAQEFRYLNDWFVVNNDAVWKKQI